MPPTRPLKVFLCHASADKPVVRKLYRYLRSKGIKPWLDAADLLPGESWEMEIQKAVFTSDVILVCISRNSINKEGYVQKEIAFALNKASEKPDGTIFIVPAKLEECDVPERLNHLQWVDLYHEDGHKRLMLSLNKRAVQLGPAVEQVVIFDDIERETVAKANSQSAVVKKPLAQVEEPIEVKQEKTKLNKVIRIPKTLNKPLIGIIGILGIFIFVLVAKFGLSSLIRTPSPQPTFEVIVPISFCTPDSPIANVYRATLQPWANAIFESAFPLVPTPIPPNPPIQFDEQQILRARYAAFQQLVNETKRWSDTQTINLEDSSEVSITLTYISPELLQAMFLNEVLKNRSPTYGFEDQLQKELNAIAAREELLFLLTATTTNTNLNPTLHTIKIPIESMLLSHAEDFTVSPSDYVHATKQLVGASSDSVFGYLAYPLTWISASECKAALDPKYYTNNVTIILPYIEVDDVSNEGSISWTIPYVILINPFMPTNTPVWNLPTGYDPNLTPMTPLSLPPRGMNRTNNWQDFARFVWGQLRLGNY